MNETEERQSWFLRNKAVVQGVASALVVTALVALFLWINDVNEDQGSQGDQLKVIVSATPCLPKPEEPNGGPRDPRKCKASFREAVEGLTPEQSCFIIQRGAGLLVVNGERVTQVECVRGIEETQKNQHRGEGPGSEAVINQGEESEPEDGAGPGKTGPGGGGPGGDGSPGGGGGGDGEGDSGDGQEPGAGTPGDDGTNGEPGEPGPSGPKGESGESGGSAAGPEPKPLLPAVVEKLTPPAAQPAVEKACDETGKVAPLPICSP